MSIDWIKKIFKRKVKPAKIEYVTEKAEDEYNVLLVAMDISISKQKGRVNVAHILQTLWRRGYKIVKEDE